MKTYGPSEAFREYSRRVKAVLDHRLASAYPPEGERGSIEHTYEAMRYMMFLGDGGKRIRPILALLAAEACGGDQAAALPYAQAVEEMHTYTLIIDDIQDHGETRRNVPTCHIRFGVNTALLAAGRLFERSLEPYHLMALEDRAEVRKLVDDLHRGQAADLDAATWPDERMTLSNLHFIYGGKSSALFQLAVWGGAVGAGATDAQKKALYRFGYYLGLAFQGRDDVLGASSTVTELGKPTGEDVDRLKLTGPKLMGSAEAAQKAVLELADKARGSLDPALFGDITLLRELSEYAVLRNR